MTPTTPTLGLRGEYNPELRKRDEWARLATTLTALETMKEASPEPSKKDFSSLWAARDADFSFKLIYQSRTLSKFDVLDQTHSLKLNALLLTPSRLSVTTRHQTATAIQKFTEANKKSLGVIMYLMDARSSGNEQIEAVQSLGALHHCLSLGFSEPPPVLVVSDASYLLDCVSAYMKCVSRANPILVNTADVLPKPTALVPASFAATSFQSRSSPAASVPPASVPPSPFQPSKFSFSSQDKK
ncbi:hypothetical protein CBS147332_6270 [Penicillium roqueforti]|nr:hypothetical protein CBS147332_6270 [Penicillium roqueforti]KAI3098661.1 hypothetical protein CBS147331_8735 [Penicillium roqueforti]